MNGKTVLAPRLGSFNRTRLSAAGALIAVAVALLLTLLFLSSRAGAVEAPVGLGTVGGYSVLGGQTVTNTGPSTLSGATTSQLGNSSAAGLASTEVTLANIGVSPMLKPVLTVGSLLCVIAAVILLGARPVQALYSPRHY